jgi:tRNA dimethylallyltransferase
MAIEIAGRIGAEIVSVDSMQVYRGLDIGTAKPTLIERRGVPHHMIDLVEPSDEFSVAEFRRIGRQVLDSSDAPMVVTGGSGLHFRALVDPMSFAPTDAGLRAELEESSLGTHVAELQEADPEAGRYVDLANERRVIRAVEIYRLTGETPASRASSAEAGELDKYIPEVAVTAVGVDPGAEVDERIRLRLTEMRSGGLVDEVRSLRGKLGRTARSAVGYREILDHLEGRSSLDEAFEAIARNTRKLARRQRTWFQRDPRVRWIPWMDDQSERVARALEVFDG